MNTDPVNSDSEDVSRLVTNELMNKRTNELNYQRNKGTNQIGEI